MTDHNVAAVMQRLRALADGVHGQADLPAYAAHAALAKLLPAWEVMLREGDTLKNVANDLLDVIALLQQFHAEMFWGMDNEEVSK
jgi:hypothetical protein